MVQGTKAAYGICVLCLEKVKKKVVMCVLIVPHRSSRYANKMRHATAEIPVLLSRNSNGGQKINK